MNYFDYFRNIVERRIELEAYYYLDNTEKNKLKTALNENTNLIQRKITLNLIDIKNSNSIIFVLSTIFLSFTYDRFYQNNKNYLRNSRNFIVRLLVLNSIYYVLLTDYQKFYENAYLKYCHKMYN